MFWMIQFFSFSPFVVFAWFLIVLVQTVLRSCQHLPRTRTHTAPARAHVCWSRHPAQPPFGGYSVITNEHCITIAAVFPLTISQAEGHSCRGGEQVGRRMPGALACHANIIQRRGIT